MAQPASATLATLKHRVADDDTAEAAQKVWPVFSAQRQLHEVTGAGSATRRKTTVIWFAATLTSKLPARGVPGICQVRRQLRIGRALGQRFRPLLLDAPDRKGEVAMVAEAANVQSTGRPKVT